MRIVDARETVSAISDQTDAPCRRTSRPSFGAMTSWWKRSIGSQMRNVDRFLRRTQRGRAAEQMPHDGERASTQYEASPGTLASATARTELALQDRRDLGRGREQVRKLVEHNRHRRIALPERHEAPITCSQLVKADGYAKPRVLSVQPADRSEVLRRRLLEPGEHEARGQLGKQLLKEGLALAPAAVDDSESGPEGPVRRERRELRPLGISIEEPARSCQFHSCT